MIGNAVKSRPVSGMTFDMRNVTSSLFLQFQASLVSFRTGVRREKQRRKTENEEQETV
jgi:hypothetical protein